RGRVWWRARTRVTAWADKMMAIPVDADSRISEPFVAAVERDVLIDLALVLLDISLHAFKGRLFFDRENENQVAFGFDFRFIKRPDRRQQRLDVARVVANAGRVKFSIEIGRASCRESVWSAGDGAGR